MNVTCPECRATLEPDEIDRVERRCPLCSASLGDVDLSSIEDQLAHEESIAGNPDQLTERSSASFCLDGEGIPDSVLEIIENTPDRLVAHLPPNGHGTRGLGAFVLAWNGFMAVFTTIGFLIIREKPIEIFPVLFVAVFWAIGIGIAILWFRVRWMRVYMLLEKDRLVIQRKLWGTRTREIPLGPGSKATLVESYRVNEVPVYQISVQGDGNAESFGVGLPEADQQELARKINQFLGVEFEQLPTGKETYCSACGCGFEPESGSSLCAKCQTIQEQSGTEGLWPPLRSGDPDFPEDVEVSYPDIETTVIQYPLLSETGILRSARLFSIVFAATWVGVCAAVAVISLQQGKGLMPVLLSTLMSFPVIVIAGLARSIFRASIKIQLSPQTVQMSWGWGPMAIRKQFPVATITHCGVIKAEYRSDSHRSTQRGSAGMTAIRAGGVPYPLVLFRQQEYSRQIVRIVRTALADLTGKPLEFE